VTWDQIIVISGYRAKFSPPHRHTHSRNVTVLVGIRKRRFYSRGRSVDTHVRVREIDRDLAIWLGGNDVARRLTTIPGIGPIGATALAASVTDPHQFRSGRQFAAWLGLTPLQK
jgi:transposase IS116/IS110/IS902 family protein